MRLLFPLFTCVLATRGAPFTPTTESLSTTTTMARTTTEEPACPPGWVNAHDEGSFTFLGEETNLTWFEAMLVCEQVRAPRLHPAQAGGYLAEPKTLEQMEFLAGIAGLEESFYDIHNWWIGLADVGSEGVWTWLHSHEV